MEKGGERKVRGEGEEEEEEEEGREGRERGGEKEKPLR